MEALISELNYWHWWSLAAALVVAEILIPGIFCLWLGIAAALTGLAAFALPSLGWQAEVVLFTALSVACAFVGSRVYARAEEPSDHPTLNRRGAQYIGQVFTLDSAIVNGTGRLKVADGTWKVTGPDLPAATQVRVVGVDGSVLRVEAV